MEEEAESRRRGGGERTRTHRYTHTARQAADGGALTLTHTPPASLPSICLQETRRDLRLGVGRSSQTVGGNCIQNDAQDYVCEACHTYGPNPVLTFSK